MIPGATQGLSLSKCLLVSLLILMGYIPTTKYPSEQKEGARQQRSGSQSLFLYTRIGKEELRGHIPWEPHRNSKSQPRVVVDLQASGILLLLSCSQGASDNPKIENSLNMGHTRVLAVVLGAPLFQSWYTKAGTSQRSAHL